MSSSLTNISYSVVSSFTITVIGIAANLFVVLLVARCPALRTAPNVYVASLAVTDFIFCLWYFLASIAVVDLHDDQPMTAPNLTDTKYVTNLTNVSNFTNMEVQKSTNDDQQDRLSWFLSNFDFDKVLEVNRMIAVLLAHTSIYLLVAIAVERYKAILRPLEHLRTNTLGRAVRGCCLAALAAAMSTTLDTVGRIAATNDWNFTGKSLSNLTGFLDVNPDTSNPLFFLQIVEFLIAYFIPACICLFIYVRIFLKLRQSQRFVARRSGDHAFRMVFVVTIFFLICWLPIQIICFNVHFFIADRSTFFQIGSFTFALNSMGNPFLYALLGKNFRLQIKRMFCCSSCKGNLRMRRVSFSNAAGTEPSAPNVQVLRVLQVSRDALEEADVEVVTAKIEEDKTEMEDVGEGIGMAEDVGKKVEETEEETGIDKDVEKAIGEQEDVEEERSELKDTEEDTSIAEGVLKEIREMKERKEDTGIAKDVLKKMEEMEFEERQVDTDMAENVEKEKRGLEDTKEDIAGDLRCENQQIAPQH